MDSRVEDQRGCWRLKRFLRETGVTRHDFGARERSLHHRPRAVVAAGTRSAQVRSSTAAKGRRTRPSSAAVPRPKEACSGRCAACRGTGQTPARRVHGTPPEDAEPVRAYRAIVVEGDGALRALGLEWSERRIVNLPVEQLAEALSTRSAPLCPPLATFAAVEARHGSTRPVSHRRRPTALGWPWASVTGLAYCDGLSGKGGVHLGDRRDPTDRPCRA